MGSILGTQKNLGSFEERDEQMYNQKYFEFSISR